MSKFTTSKNSGSFFREEKLTEKTRRQATKCDIGKSCGTAALLKENHSKEKEEVVAEGQIFCDWDFIKEEER